MAGMSFNQNFTSVGLNTLQFTIPTAGPYNLVGTLTLPQQYDDGGTGQSSCVVTINQNGSPIYVGLPGAEGFQKNFLGAVGDVMQVVTSSSNPIDLPLNVIKATIGCRAGQ
jgi:hypothetical protein